PAHDDRAHVLPPSLDDRRAGSDLTPLAAVPLVEGLEREHPLVQLLPADAQRVLLALVRPRDVAVQGRRDDGSDLSHVRALLFARNCPEDRPERADSSRSPGPCLFVSVSPWWSRRG